MTKRWNNKLLALKLETVYGTDSAPAGAQAILATQVELSPMEGQDKSRDLELPYLGAQGTIPIDLHQMLKFRVELQGSGTAGTPPAWGPILRACGFAETITANTSVVYNPVSTGHESLSVYLFIDGTRFVMLGARGTVTLRVNSSDIPYLEFELKSLFTVPSEAAQFTPSYSQPDPTPVGAATTPTFTIGGAAFNMRSFSLAAGNDVQGRFLVGDEKIMIVDRAEAAEFQIEAVPLTVWDPFTVAKSAATFAVQLIHGTAAGKIATINMPRVQLQRPSNLAEAQGITEWPLAGTPLPSDVGNDQFTLTLT